MDNCYVVVLLAAEPIRQAVKPTLVVAVRVEASVWHSSVPPP